MSTDLNIVGLASGINTSDIIDKLMSIERQPLTDMQNREALLEKQQSAWRDLNNNLLTLSNKLQDLQNVSTFTSKTVASSDATVVTATAGTAAISGTYNVQVARLAQADSVNSTANIITDSNQALSTQFANAGLTFQAGNITVGGAVINVTATDSLNSLAAKINKAQTNVSATVINNKLVFTSNQTGVANQLVVGTATGSNLFDISDGDSTHTADSNVLTQLGVYTGTTFNNYLTVAADADVYINGIEVISGSNTITNAVNGLSISVKAVSQSVGTTGDPVKDLKATSLQVSVDTQTAVDKVKAFVDQYNTVMSFLSDETKYDSNTKQTGDLFADSMVLQLQDSLRQMVGGALPVGTPGLNPKYNSLAQIGISTTGQDATLSFDQTKFSAALNDDPNGIATLFGANITNVALASNGASVTASSETTGYAASGVIDGVTSYDNWGNNGGWQSDGLPAYVDIDFGSIQSINEVLLQTINSTAYPASQYGIKDFSLQYWDSTLAQWNTLKTITGNTQSTVDLTFNTVQTQKIRVNITADNGSNGGNSAARLVEVEAFAYNPGIAASMDNLINNYTMYGTGLVNGRISSLDQQIKDLKDQMDSLQTRLDLRQQTLQNQFDAMEQAIQGFKSQGSSLTSMLAQLPSTSSK